jgi:hypothetical protein
MSEYVKITIKKNSRQVALVICINKQIKIFFKCVSPENFRFGKDESSRN